MGIRSISVPQTATTVLWGVFLRFAHTTLAQEDADSNYSPVECPKSKLWYLDFAGQCPSPYSVDTGPEEWTQCPELDGWTEQCPPTVSIERAACLAPLVVNARVVSTVWDKKQPDYGNAKVLIGFDRPETSTFGINKWGAGLDYDTLMSAGANYTYFSTWISGFNNTPSSGGILYSPCGTLTPPPNQEQHFFLQREEGDASPAIIDPETQTLSINFTLSTSVLSSGYAARGGQFLWIRDGITAEQTLEGDCDLLYCCYNPECDAQDCSQRLQSAKEEYGFECNWWPTSGGADWISSVARYIVAGIVIAHSTVQMLYI